MPLDAPKIAEQEVIDAWTLFQIALSKRGPYPFRELEQVFESVQRYTQAMANSEFIHKSVAGMFTRFHELIELERKRVPSKAKALAYRLETILFDGYDPQFEGDEPPGF